MSDSHERLEAAKQTVRVHAGHVIEEDRRSIVALLRPYEGVSETDFHELVHALIVLHPTLGQTHLDRDIVYACWDWCVRLRILTPTLARNGLVDEHQRRRLEWWEQSVESFCRRGLNQCVLEECLMGILEYIASEHCEAPSVYRDLRPLLLELKQECTDWEALEFLDGALAATS